MVKMSSTKRKAEESSDEEEESSEEEEEVKPPKKMAKKAGKFSDWLVSSLVLCGKIIVGGGHGWVCRDNRTVDIWGRHLGRIS